MDVGEERTPFDGLERVFDLEDMSIRTVDDVRSCLELVRSVKLT
jgi:hypothetical protein